MTVKVLQRHIDRARELLACKGILTRASACPIALACSEAGIALPLVSVASDGRNKINLGSDAHGKSWQAGRKALLWMHRFDGDKVVGPFSFRASVREEIP